MKTSRVEMFICNRIPLLVRRSLSTTHLVKQAVGNPSFRRRPSHDHKNRISYTNYSDVSTEKASILSSTPVATSILNEPTIIIERQIEVMNIVVGFEQANKYKIMDVRGNALGRIEERDYSIGKAALRQLSKLHRPFTVDVFDNYNNVILTIKRPFSWVNSHIQAILPNEETGQFDEGSQVVGESVQKWHAWRRKYELFANTRDEEQTSSDPYFKQFGVIDAPFLSFEFAVRDKNNKIIGGVDRNWVGIGRELFTDTGIYIVRFDSTRSFENIYPPETLSTNVMTLDERAVLLANAISIDFDYFSRHSRSTGGGLLTFGGDGYE
ncbi:hypothetical protein TPHA_0I02830 [Tetrapisispora phaffii CBS 4417]|uniref:Phospholipid scramblase n=1 Tax=Tetrapisispora phaffii (strain ATCC 24235 / CBS 4417 / NBRC 1672 / NRRL Y-8282 / UCD 70-5) TaxID=1071381 RepID=G8BY06_TETPH|nr:hypothetical protein TPHA_0I02830 [Tetrapisispora phaffii CBS 4417]CCE64784.1 hypothetical protein TPHA_0I02830 [Tetrapisispora phaffii CBS 4417]